MGRLLMAEPKQGGWPPSGYRNECECHWVLASTAPVAYRLEEWCPRHRELVIRQGANPDRPFYQVGSPPTEARLDP